MSIFDFSNGFKFEPVKYGLLVLENFQINMGVEVLK
jgi:hypothetical protein